MAENLANFFESQLNGSITNSATSLDVDSATGAPAANFRIVVQDGETDETNRELMLVTAVATNTFTVGRLGRSRATPICIFVVQADATFMTNARRGGAPSTDKESYVSK